MPYPSRSGSFFYAFTYQFIDVTRVAGQDLINLNLLYQLNLIDDFGDEAEVVDILNANLLWYYTVNCFCSFKLLDVPVEGIEAEC